jgi:hypothetical protein
LDLLEKRLLTLCRRWVMPFEFRDMVQTYSFARSDMGFGRTSTADAFRALEWNSKASRWRRPTRSIAQQACAWGTSSFPILESSVVVCDAGKSFGCLLVDVVGGWRNLQTHAKELLTKDRVHVSFEDMEVTYNMLELA